ncbi:MAG TPA: hypothetical protein VFI38_13350 [Candidatus Acidoferrum sp.]|nr:hypothetical protein [Candidatus Acidoferrum sp.]
MKNFATVLQFGGIGGVGLGLVLSLHHIPAAAALIGGGVAYFIGKKLRGQ